MVNDGGGLTFAVLGRLRAWRDGEALELGSPQQRTLLAELLLRQGHAASAAEIVDAIWGENPPPRAVGALRTYVSRLRKLLEPERGPGVAPRLLVSVSDGYALRVPRQALDVARFEDRVAAAARARACGRLTGARDLLRSALALWTDEPLLGLTGAQVHSRRARLADRRLMALETRLELDLELGAAEPALRELAELTARHPLRERLCALRLIALHRVGRSAEALVVYEETRRALSEELGLEPGRELVGVQRRILAAVPDGPAPGAGPIAPGERAVPAQLPGDLADFTGREETVAELCRALAPEHPRAVVTVAVSGIGGVGKSALAVHAAHRVREDFPHGQFYADLQGTGEHPADPAGVLGSFLRALGVDDAAVPDGLAERAACFRTQLADRRVLILLDNARDADQVRPFLPGTPSCAVLITSRAKLGDLPSAGLTHLDVMTAREAVTLLGRVVGTERTEAEPEAAAQLVSACGFLPLAVRIVAARLATRPTWTLATLNDRLADRKHRLAELRVADLAVEAAFALGYYQLDDRARRTFRLLSLPDGTDISAAAAAAVLGLVEREAEPLCEALVDASLLESPAPGRYRFHDLLRLFARERAEAEESPRQRADALRRLMEFYVATARASHLLTSPGAGRRDVASPAPGLTFDSADAARDWLFTEASCLFAAVGQAVAEPSPAVAPAADLLLMMDGLFEYGAYGREFEQAARAVIAGALRAADRRSAGRAYLVLGSVYYHADRLVELVPVCREALALSRAADDPLTTADCLVQLSRCDHHMRRHDAARERLSEALAVFRANGDRFGEANAFGALARVYLALGHREPALMVAEEGLALHRALGSTHLVGQALYQLGIVLAGTGRTEESAARLTEALTLFGAHRNRLWEGLTLFRMAENDLAAGAPERAARHAERAVATLEEVRDAWGRAKALAVLGHALDLLHHPDRARASRIAAYEIFLRLGVPEADDLRTLLTRADVRESTCARDSTRDSARESACEEAAARPVD